MGLKSGSLLLPYRGRKRSGIHGVIGNNRGIGTGVENYQGSNFREVLGSTYTVDKEGLTMGE